MKKVNNKEVIRRIADKTRKADKGRNLIAVLAIALTTVLFTALFTISSSMLKKTQEETMRMVGTSSHAGLKYLTQEEYDKVKKDKWLKEVSCRIFSGILVNEELKKLNTEVNYFDAQDAKWSFITPYEGRMPEKKNEIVTSDLVLEKLGAECKPGTTVKLKIEINGKVIEKEFILSGYYKGDIISMAQMAAVSKAFQEEYAPTPTLSAMEHKITASDYDGRIAADFNFYTSFGIEKQTKALCKRLGFPETAGTGVNWAYLGQDDSGAVIGVILLLFLILFSGYLIIYNIFSINVYRDITYYGLLKTIGTTGKQLKKIVMRQAYVLALFGIPFGLFAGVFISSIVLPFVMRAYETMDGISSQIELNIGILLGAALFSLVTVWVGCSKPCRIASRVTPVEAIQFTEGQPQEIFGEHTKGKAVKKQRKKTKKVSPVALALQNVQRSRRKRNIVIASLSLALILLNSVYSIISGFDIDTYVSRFIVCDFSVQDASLDNTFGQERVMDGVTDDFLAALKQQEGITETGNIYAKEIPTSFTKEQNALVEKRILNNKKALEYITSLIPPYDEDGKEYGVKEYIKELEEKKQFDGTIYGMSQLLTEKLEAVEGDFDWEKFRTGDYVVATRFWDDITVFKPGEKVTLSNEQGEKREYEVLAVANVPYACAKQWISTIEVNFILPEEEYLDFIGESQPMRTLFNVKEGTWNKMDKWIETYCKMVNPDLDCKSRKNYEQEFAEYTQMVFIVGNGLAVVLACIGILNFINTVLTSVLSRKQEFAMMEAVGMSGRQLKKMLCMEGGYYALCTALISLVAGALSNLTFVRMFGQEMISYRWKFTVTPVVLCIPVLLAIVVAVPLFGFRVMVKDSVVERMRKNY